jgi:sigma-E factor negative regulatory protein RseA
MINRISQPDSSGELISALADGQLGPESLEAALQACRAEVAAVGSWSTYHLIGDVLRSPAQAVFAADPAFVARLSQKLAGEPLRSPAMHAGAARPAPLHPDASAHDLDRRHGEASNDSSFRWKLAAGFASLAAISAIAWSLGTTVTAPAGALLAQAPAAPQVIVDSPQGPIVRDARLEELLAAHKQLGGTSALQVPSGFMRNATFETPVAAGAR